MKKKVYGMASKTQVLCCAAFIFSGIIGVAATIVCCVTR